MIKSEHLLFLCILFFVQCSTSVYTKLPSKNNKAEPGKPKGPGCYAKCLIEDKYDVNPINIIEYTGSNFNDPNVQQVEIETKPASSKWIKKPRPGCVNAKPEDCLVWCLVETEAEFYNGYTVSDTTVIKDYVYKKIEQKILIQQGGHTEWREVLCEKQINNLVITEIQNALLVKGYDIGVTEADGHFQFGTKEGLKEFQKDNNLPLGQLDFETLSALGVNY